MSVEAIAWVLNNSPTQGSEKVVLLGIANHADRDGHNAWPSRDTLATYARLDPGRVRKILRKLEADGAILVEPGMGGPIDRRVDRRTNRYTVVMDGGVEATPRDPAAGGSTGAARGGRDDRRGGVDAPPEPSLNRPEEPSEEKTAAAPLVLVADDPRSEPGYRFADFWNAYPQRNGKRVGRAKTFDRWKALPYDDKAAAFRGVAYYRRHCDAGLTLAKDPERWLRDRCWDDWQDPPDETATPASQRERRLVATGQAERFAEALGYGPPQLTEGTAP